MCKKIVVIVIVSMFILTGCASMEGEFNVKDPRKVIESTDWSKMETVTVKLSEHKFAPFTLTFKTGIPYRLQIKNVGSMKHYFVSEDFFKIIAIRKIQSSEGEMMAPYFTAIEIFPGRTVDLYFVPVKKGRYRLVCTVQGHAELGMVGTIIVEQSRRTGRTPEGGYGATY
jgi:uncharacterized cupredoxin-like copper-binding protein